MKFFILNTDYPAFLNWLYSVHQGLEDQPYEYQMRVRNESLFAVADFYSRNLRKLGHEAYDIHVNNEFMQKAWDRENRLKLAPRIVVPYRFRRLLQRLVRRTPALKQLECLVSDQPSQKCLYDILKAQIRHYRPDVVVNQDMISLHSAVLRKISPTGTILVGETDAAFPANKPDDYRFYDLVRCSLPKHLAFFRRLGVECVPYQFGFETDILDLMPPPQKRDIPVSFVGSLSFAHRGRAQFLEEVCKRVNVRIWAPGISHLDSDSPIRDCYAGQAWGVNLYRILSHSRITLNCQIDSAENFADNMRLYEATGVGTLLITDYKDNLRTLFEPGKEVVAYRSAEECVELINYYLEHEEDRKAVAHAGQQRALREHTYYHRMQELVDIVTPLLRQRRKRRRDVGVGWRAANSGGL